MTRALTALFAVSMAVSASQAAPVVRVKARTGVRLDPIRRLPGGIEIRGVVVDRSVRAGVPWASVVVSLDDSSTAVVTADDQGEFSHRFWVTEGVHTLRARFEGTPMYEASDAALEGFDVTKEPLALSIRTMRETSIEAGPLVVIVTARAESGPVSIVAAITAGDAGSDRLRRVGAVTTDESGRGEVEIPTDQLGEPGRKQLEVRFAGNDAYDVATAQTELLLTTETRIEFSVDSTDVKYEDDVVGKGRLSDAGGEPIAGASIGLINGSKRVADAITSPDGKFELSVEASELGAGKRSLQAKFDSPEAWRKSTRSPPVAVTIYEPQPVPMRYTVAAFAATAFAVFAFVLMRTRPWNALLTRWRPDDDDDDRDNDSGPVSALREVRTGLMQARPSLVSTLRRASDFGFAGTVRDAVTGRPVRGAEIVLAADAQEPQARVTGADGAFEFETLSAGSWTAVVAGATYCTERFDIALPHRGELRGARVDLMPVRERIFRIYRDAALPLLPDPGQWGIWTPRQIFAHVRDQRPARALASLTDFVEENYFSQRIPNEDILEDARQRARAAQAEQQQPVV
jgi:hypothetical protein